MENHRSVLGIDETTTALLGYVLPLVALILLFIQKKNRFVRFHALQSLLFMAASVAVLTAYLILTEIILAGLSMANSETLDSVGYLLTLLSPIGALVWFAGLMFVGYKAYGGEMYKVPLIGKIADQWTR